jgi:two-component system, OmpR family, KDP operon response regulator KdpE
MLVKTKVLAISRDNALVNFLQRVFSDGEYDIVNTNFTGVQLKTILDTERPGFIILDIVMPSLDGVGICLQLRQWTQTPVMMLSTWRAGSGTVRGLNLCSENYLSEPFSGDILKKRIRETLDRNDLTELIPAVHANNN